MPPSKRATPPVRAAEPAAPLAPDTLDALTGEALREALLARVADAIPREGAALRRAAQARVAAVRLREELAQAELAAVLLRERAGRYGLARSLVVGDMAPAGAKKEEG